MIYAEPESTFISDLTNAPADQVGTLAWRLEDSDDQIVIARTTSGITEFANGNYRRSATAPSEAGVYFIIWDDGDADPDERVETSERLEVTFDAPVPSAPVAGFITVSELGDYLDQDLDEDETAELAVQAACDVIRTLTEQTIDVVTDDEVTLDGSGTDALLLPQLPVLAVSSVVEDDETVETSDYRVGENGVLCRASSSVNEEGWIPPAAWAIGRRNIVVTYSHGYEDLPADLRMVALMIAARFFQQGIVQYESIGSYQVRYGSENAAELSLTEKAILRKYRNAPRAVAAAGS